MSKPTLEDSAKSSEQPVKTERWFVNFNKTFGPIATEQVRNLVRKGILRVDTPIRMDGESKWIVLAQSTVMEGLDPVAVSDAGSGSDIPNPNANGKSNVFKWVFALFMIGAPVGVHQYWQREVHKINSDLDEQKSSLVVKDQMLETQKVEIERLRAELEEARKKAEEERKQVEEKLKKVLEHMGVEM